MARFKFSVGGPDGVRHAGIVRGDDFKAVIEAIGGQFETTDGDFLEIGVEGFPPARYTMVDVEPGISGWKLANQLAA